MNQPTSISVLSTSQDFEVDRSNMEGHFDGLRSSFKIFIKYSLHKPSGASRIGLVSVLAKLKLLNPSIELSECLVQVGIETELKEMSSGDWYIFKLDESAIHTIEKYRKGDLNLSVELSVLASVTHAPFYPSGGVIKENPHAMHFSISRSDWVEKIFPRLGYETFKLIEIPLTHSSLKEAYDDIVEEFCRAEEYFNKPDYNKCVAHCRHTLDALKRNLIKIKKQIKSETGFGWLETINKSTFDWIDSLEKANAGITAKTHHAGQKTDFTRNEAESIYLITLGLLNYVGHIAK